MLAVSAEAHEMSSSGSRRSMATAKDDGETFLALTDAPKGPPLALAPLQVKTDSPQKEPETNSFWSDPGRSYDSHFDYQNHLRMLERLLRGHNQ